jgi:DNA sulfur modification protein DndB
MANKGVRDDVLDEFAVTFPAMRGVQARTEFFVIMCPLRYLPRLFLFDEEDVPPEVRAQRGLNRNRLPGLVRYILDNREDYVFSALTASVDGPMRFDAHSPEGHGHRLGVLHLSMDAKFLINDGQHRRAAIEEAMKDDPSLGDETIPIVIFRDRGLKRSQQMFADLNRHAVRPARSLGVLYDHRDDDSGIVRLMVSESDLFHTLVERESSSLSARSRKLFTLSSVYRGTQSLLHGRLYESADEAAQAGRLYWETVANFIPEWDQVRRGRLSSGDVRAEFIHSHGIALHALGRVGSTVLAESDDPATWAKALSGLESIDWSRRNARLWEGRALTGGRVSKSTNNVTLTTNVLRRALGQPLSPEEQRVEDAFQGGRE